MSRDKQIVKCRNTPVIYQNVEVHSLKKMDVEVQFVPM